MDNRSKLLRAHKGCSKKCPIHTGRNSNPHYLSGCTPQGKNRKNKLARLGSNHNKRSCYICMGKIQERSIRKLHNDRLQDHCISPNIQRCVERIYSGETGPMGDLDPVTPFEHCSSQIARTRSVARIRLPSKPHNPAQHSYPDDKNAEHVTTPRHSRGVFF